MAIHYRFNGYKQTEVVKRDFQRKLVDRTRNVPLQSIHGRVSFNKQGPIHQLYCDLATKEGAKIQLEATGSSPEVCIEKMVYKINSYFMMLDRQREKRKAN